MPVIPLSTAKEMTRRYVANRTLILNSAYSAFILPLNETFTKEDIEMIINQEGCTSFRIYYGMKEDLSICAIFTAVDANENDILAESNTIIIEEGKRCPPTCPTVSLDS